MSRDYCENNDKSKITEITELIIASIAILIFISMLFVLAKFPDNQLKISHVVFGAIAGLSGISIWEDKINC